MYFQTQPNPLATQQNTTVIWNGKEWVKSPVVKSNTFSSYTYAQQNPTVSSPSNPVPQPSGIPSSAAECDQAIKQYSEYKEHWASQAKSHREKAATMMPGPEKDEMVRVAAWGDHYAKLSDEALKYYQKTRAHRFREALQIAPIPQISPSLPQKTIVSFSKPTVVATEEATAESGNNDIHLNLSRYVSRAIKSCSQSERCTMQSLVQKKINSAKKFGTLFTTDWDNEPYPVVPTPTQSNSFSPDAFLSTLSSSQSKLSNNGKNNGSTQSMSRQVSSEKEDVVQTTDKSLRKRLFSNSFDESSVYPFKKTDSSPKELELKYVSLNSMYGNDIKKEKVKSVLGKKKKNKKMKEMNGFECSSKAMNRRKSRFADSLVQETDSCTLNTYGQYMGTSVIGGSKNVLLESDYERMTVKGTCQRLEKEYLRLTSPPKAENVRPQYILEQHLENLKTKWNKSRLSSEYQWFCSQFKAIRQDLTVQRIFNSFTVDCYETHAKIALENSDLNEFNQCQTQLKELYMMLSQSETRSFISGLKNQNEFIAYRIIYYVFLMKNEKYEGGSSDLLRIILNLTEKQKKDVCIKHALKVRIAVADVDYYGFFRLYKVAPLMSASLMDFLVPSIRLLALQRICKAYRPIISTNFILTELGFNSKDLIECQCWIERCGGKLSSDGKELLTKDSIISAPLSEEKNSLI